MFSIKWLISPIRIVFIFFGLQILLWFFLFPEYPTLPNGEPRSHNLDAQILYFGLLLVFIISIKFGQSIPKRTVNQHFCPSYNNRIDHNIFYAIGKISFWLGLLLNLWQLFFIFINPRLFLLLLRPYGQNQLARKMHEENISFIPSLSWLLLVSIVIFSLYYFKLPSKDKRKIILVLYIVVAMLFLMLFSIVGMTRQASIVGIIVILGAWAMSFPSDAKIKIIPVVILVLFIIVYFFMGAAMRMGGIKAALTQKEIYRLVWVEFIEKYTPGELNNTFIMLSYPTDISRNWLYATMFARFTPDYFSPPRYLNTINSLGLWYWQFSWFSIPFAAMMGILIGKNFKEAELTGFAPGWSTFFYLISLPVLITMTRVNSFFLQSYLIPFLFLFIARVLLLIINPTHLLKYQNEIFKRQRTTFNKYES